MRVYPKGSAEYEAARRLIDLLGGRALSPLLENLADEPDMAARKSLVDLLSTMAQDHIPKLGACVSDSRWYFVRNVVAILGVDEVLGGAHRTSSARCVTPTRGFAERPSADCPASTTGCQRDAHRLARRRRRTERAARGALPRPVRRHGAQRRRSRRSHAEKAAATGTPGRGSRRSRRSAGSAPPRRCPRSRPRGQAVAPRWRPGQGAACGGVGGYRGDQGEGSRAMSDDITPRYGRGALQTRRPRPTHGGRSAAEYAGDHRLAARRSATRRAQVKAARKLLTRLSALATRRAVLPDGPPGRRRRGRALRRHRRTSTTTRASTCSSRSSKARSCSAPSCLPRRACSSTSSAATCARSESGRWSCASGSAAPN